MTAPPPGVHLHALEFFSGVGGLHFALALAMAENKGLEQADVVAAFDLNEVANSVYAFNTGREPVRGDVRSVSLARLEAYGANAWFMSPPCQPYTRVGLKRDHNDPRALGFVYLLKILTKMHTPPTYILMENVKGFGESESRKLMIETFQRLHYDFQEFHLSPSLFGLPNQRWRYFCLAKRLPHIFAGRVAVPSGEICAEEIPGSQYFARPHRTPSAQALVCRGQGEHTESVLGKGGIQQPIRPLCEFLVSSEDASLESYRVPLILLRKTGRLFDVVRPSSRRSICFTKSYTQYVEGTGSILLQGEGDFPDDPAFLDDAELEALQLRYFTPREIARLHAFPESFSFPASTTLRQQYKLLGNSLNVRVVAELIKYLICEKLE